MDHVFQLMREVDMSRERRVPECSAAWRAFEEVYRSSARGQARELVCNVLRHHQVLVRLSLRSLVSLAGEASSFASAFVFFNTLIVEY